MESNSATNTSLSSPSGTGSDNDGSTLAKELKKDFVMYDTVKVEEDSDEALAKAAAEVAAAATAMTVDEKSHASDDIDDVEESTSSMGDFVHNQQLHQSPSYKASNGSNNIEDEEVDRASLHKDLLESSVASLSCLSPPSPGHKNHRRNINNHDDGIDLDLDGSAICNMAGIIKPASSYGRTDRTVSSKRVGFDTSVSEFGTSTLPEYHYNNHHHNHKQIDDGVRHLLEMDNKNNNNTMMKNNNKKNLFGMVSIRRRFDDKVQAMKHVPVRHDYLQKKEIPVTTAVAATTTTLEKTDEEPSSSSTTDIVYSSAADHPTSTDHHQDDDNDSDNNNKEKSKITRKKKKKKAKQQKQQEKEGGKKQKEISSFYTLEEKEMTVREANVKKNPFFISLMTTLSAMKVAFIYLVTLETILSMGGAIGMTCYWYYTHVSCFFYLFICLFVFVFFSIFV